MREFGETTAVLLTEDEALISLDLCEILEDAGYRVIGPAMTATEALSLLEGESPRVAMIDFLLRDGPCTELAQQLHQRGVPFLVYSGREPDASLTFELRDAPWLAKPALASDIVIRLEELLKTVAMQ
jgi:DNA-binding response OmpR family regulator